MKKYTSFFKESDDHRFGLESSDGSISFLVPKELMPSEKENNLIKQITTLQSYANILCKYYRYKANKEKDINSNINQKKIDRKFEHIQGLIFIFDDYMKNDLYRIQKTNYNIKNKKINWNKTFKKNDIIVSKNRIIHSNFISEKKNTDKESEFYQLYLFALNFAYKTFLGSDLISDVIDFKLSKNKIKYIINCFLDENFADQDISIAKALESFYLSSNNNDFHKDLFKTPYHEKFEYIWEFMINEIIPKNDVNLLDLNLRKEGKYQKVILNDNLELMVENDRVKIANGLSYIIDHIIYLKEKNYICILDSKFYDFYLDYTNNPNTESIGKQANYRDRIIKKLNKKNIKNIVIKNFFIFPKNNGTKNIELFAKHIVEGDEDYDIYCLAIDINFVIDYFNKSRKSKEIIEYLNHFKNL